MRIPHNAHYVTLSTTDAPPRHPRPHPRADLVHAAWSLPFCPPASFPRLWDSIVAALRPGGVFAGQLFGDRDSWAAEPDMTFHTEAQARAVLSPLETLVFREEEN